MEITDHNENNMPNDITSLGLQNDIYSASNNEDTTSIPDVENQEDKREQVLSKIKKAGRDFLTVAALGSILITAYGCSPKEVNSITNIEDKPTATLKSNLPVEENRPTATHTLEPTITNTPTLTPEPTPTEEPTPTPQPEIDPKEFDYSMLDLMQWEGELEVSDIEKLDPGHIVEVREGYKTVLYSLPLFNDFPEDKYNYTGIRIFDIPEGFKFELLETRKVTGEDGKNITMAIVRNASSQRTCEGIFSVVLSAENEDGEIINFTQEKADIMASASIGDFYGSLHWKDQESSMLVLRNIMEYQKQHGPFVAGNTYSIRDVANMESNEFSKLFYYPDSSNITVDQTVGTITNLLINTTKTAFRTPKRVEDGAGLAGLNTVFSNRKTFGTHLKKNPSDSSDNDVVLTFQEGPNGEKSYYIYGDTMERGGMYYLTFYLAENLDKDILEKHTNSVNDIYQMVLDWERTGHLFKWGEVEGLQTYLYGELFYDEAKLKKWESVIRKIAPLIDYDDFFR